MNAKRILVVDDEQQITRVLRTVLQTHGYEVRVAEDGIAALEQMSAWEPDLVITDLAMPRMDGVLLSAEIRNRSAAVPIIVLSVREQEKYKVEALDTGADDYVTKPFGIQELLARVRAQLRRAQNPTSEHTAGPITIGDFVLDKEMNLVTVEGNAVHLSPKEFELLQYLAQHPGKVLTHRILLKAIWGSYGTDQPEHLRVLVGQLRKKIESGSSPKYIVTEPWVGYRFIPEGIQES
jgi:two-component system, OmpR family, KDP operon response regulator KdpE